MGRVRQRRWPTSVRWCAWRDALRHQRGSVSAEFAAAMPAVALVLTLCAGAVVAVATQVAVQDAAGEAARLAARGDEPALAVDQLDGGALDVWDSGELRCARVSVAITLAGIPTAARAQAQSCALRDIE